MLAEDGSGKGAGLVSAIAQRINERLGVHTNGNVSENVHKLPITAKVANGVHTSATNGHMTYSNVHRIYAKQE